MNSGFHNIRWTNDTAVGAKRPLAKAANPSTLWWGKIGSRSLIGVHKDAYQFVSDRYWQSGRSAGLSPLIEMPARASKIDGIEAFRKSGIDYTQKLPALARAALSMAQPPKHHRSAQFPR